MQNVQSISFGHQQIAAFPQSLNHVDLPAATLQAVEQRWKVWHNRDTEIVCL